MCDALGTWVIPMRYGVRREAEWHFDDDFALKKLELH